MIKPIVRTILLSTFALCVVVAQEETKQGLHSEWKLIWSDEFSGVELDQTKWSRVKRGNSDWKNMMSPQEDLLELKEGILKLRGVVNTDEKTKKEQPYLTAGLTSEGKFDFKYGKVEIRARFQSAKGAWPALWMLKSNAKWGRPSMGEIDIMEHLNFQDQVYQTVHSYYTVQAGKNGTKDKKLPQSGRSPIQRDKWNTYGILWDESKIVFTVNGKPTFTYPRVPSKGHEQYPFVSPFYFILSMQIEGKWVGKPDPKDYPAFMEVDYVRVYQKKGEK